MTDIAFNLARDGLASDFMPQQPSGTITFLFTDIEGSSKLWEQHPEPMRRAVARHDQILRDAFISQGGYVFKTIGDAFCVAFDIAHSALAAALLAQRGLHGERWEGIKAVKSRMALHTGAAELRDGDYFGQSLNRVSRLLSAAHGGQTLLSRATEQMVRDFLPAGVRLRELGERRLRDLARPEHIFQLLANDLPAEFPPLRSLESVPNNLPIQLTSFVGRESEMAEVKRLLGTTHLLTLTGTGGTGKTRLSLQVAADLIETFTDGVWLVEFATIDDPSLVPETVASVLEVRQEADTPITSTLTAFLRAKKLLLILDNCEHVIAGCARLAETLLRASPNLVVLASSREPLGVAGETAWPLQPMSMPENWKELAALPNAVEIIGQFEAVRLFVDRASIARPGFELRAGNAAAVAQICWRLDGIPLAIELAAARAKVLMVSQIAERLDDRFHLLTGGSRTAVPRQQTLRALIDWSFDLLGDAERKLLCRLSVFGRGRSFEAITAVCSDETLAEWEILDLLTQLVDKSLLTVEKNPDFGARYFMLESVWDYSREKLAQTGEEPAVRAKHLDFFLKFAEELAPQLIGPDQRRALGSAESEQINIRFALEASAEFSGQGQKGLRMLTALARFAEVRGLFAEARDSFSHLLALPDTAARDAIRARALAAAARLAWVSDDMPASEKYLPEAVSIFRELNDERGLAFTLSISALLSAHAGDFTTAESFIGEAAAIAERLSDKRVNALILRSESVLAANKNDYARSLSFAERSFTLCRELGDDWLAGTIQWSIGVNAAFLGRYDEARANFEDCLRGAQALGNRWGLAYPLEAFAALAAAQHQYERAARLLGAAEALRARHGLSQDQADHPALRENPGFRVGPARHARYARHSSRGPRYVRRGRRRIRTGPFRPGGCIKYEKTWTLPLRPGRRSPPGSLARDSPAAFALSRRRRTDRPSRLAK